MEDPTYGHQGAKGNRHLLDNPVPQPMGPVGVGGNATSFLRTWDRSCVNFQMLVQTTIVGNGHWI
eukprot:9168721-Karenia_brevis.AAC.1